VTARLNLTDYILGLSAMSASHTIALTACALVLAGWGGVHWQTRQHVASAGFWVDESVTFALGHLARRGGPLSGDEQRRVIAVARGELCAAFAGLRLRISDSPDAFYRVRVVQILTWHRVAVSGQSNVFGPLGGAGAVSFETLASQAIARAPGDVSRADLVDAIGRGLGRAAVHEFAHQLLPHVPIHASTDEQSYEYWNSNRPSQYYGPMRWSLAAPHLQRRLGG
jgi:hypothetical protein